MFRSVIIFGIGLTAGVVMNQQRHRVLAKAAHRIVDVIFGEASPRDRVFDQNRH